MKAATLACCAVFVMSVGTLAQSAEQEIRKVNDALLAAAKAGDAAAYGKMLGDDLRWITDRGELLSKAQRLEGVKKAAAAGASGPTFRDVDVKVYGETAVMVAVAEFPSKITQRGHRVFVKRGGQWQLVSHSATRIDPNTK